MTHRSHHRRVYRRSAFTLMEMLVVVAIIVVLAGTGGYLFMQRLEESKIKAAQLGIADVERAAKTYYTDWGSYPESVQVLMGQSSPSGRAYLDPGKINDPWGNPYALTGQVHPLTGNPQVVSTGPGGASPLYNWTE